MEKDHLLLPEGADKEQIVISGLGWEIPDPKRVVPTFLRQQHRVHFILNGVGHLKEGETEYRMTAGTGFVIFPGTVPNYYPNQEEPWEYFWVKASGALLEELLQKAGLSRQMPCFRIEGAPEVIRREMNQICWAAMNAAQEPENVADCFRNVFRNVQAFKNRNDKSDLFDECLNYIHEHYSEDISVQQIADHAIIDRTYLYKIFKKNLGCPPQTYLVDYRITQACRLLRSTDDSVTEIAYAVGFRDLANFSRQFRKRQNITPTQFRIMGDYANVTDTAAFKEER